MRENIKTEQQMIRQKINEDVEKFLSKGGIIKPCLAGVMAKREVSLRLLAEQRKQTVKMGK